MNKLSPPVNGNDHSQGPDVAPITLVEYGDFECPHCGEAYPIIKKIQQAEGDHLRFIYRHFPISEGHPHAKKAAEAAEAAGAQGKFWEMHDTLFENQGDLNNEALLTYAAQLHLDVNTFSKDLTSNTYAKRVRDDFMSGVKSGVNGTPTFFINGTRYDGSYDFEDLLAFIEDSAG